MSLICLNENLQVVNAAQLLCENKDSPVLQENMKVFEEAWLDRVKVLTMATDALVSVDDFLAVAEAHIQVDAQSAIAVRFSLEDENIAQDLGCWSLSKETAFGAACSRSFDTRWISENRTIVHVT